MIVLDTDIVGILQRASGEQFERLSLRLRNAPDWPPFVAIVTFEEQTRGWLAHIARAKTPAKQIVAYARLRGLLDFFSTQPVLDFTDLAMEQFQQLMQQRTRIGTMDLRIAAIVLANGAKLISRNLVDFEKVPGLIVEDWAR